VVGNGLTYTTGEPSWSTATLRDTVWPLWQETRTATFTSLGDRVWGLWTGDSTASTSITLNNSTYSDGVWNSWIDNSTTGTTITLRDVVWDQWIDENGRRIRLPARVAEPAINYAPPPPPNPFHVLKHKLQRRRIVRSAKKKGRALLRSICSDEQWKDYLRYGSIREIGERAIYEVGAGWTGHIYEIDFKDVPLRKLCVHMAIGRAGKHWIDEDRIAAVLLALRYDEVGTVAEACTHHFSEEQKRRVQARRGHKRRVA